MKKNRLCGMTIMCALLFAITGGQTFAAEKQYTNSIGMEFVLIPAGAFNMGADMNFENAHYDEVPVHRISITKAFYLGKFEVTQAQWMAVMGRNPSRFKGQSNPVEQVSWDDAQAFIRKLNQMEGHNRYRLPTEAEWEYAARAVSESTYSFGDDAVLMGRYAWYYDNSGLTTHPVGQKESNSFGLYDMHGNVWEWVQDWYGDTYYQSSPPSAPVGPPSGLFRVCRGGSWCNFAGDCSSARRNHGSPSFGHEENGFRVLLSPGQ